MSGGLYMVCLGGEGGILRKWDGRERVGEGEEIVGERRVKVGEGRERMRKR